MPSTSQDQYKPRHRRPLAVARGAALAVALALAVAAGPAGAQGVEITPPTAVPGLPLPTVPSGPKSPAPAQGAPGTYDQTDGLAGTWSYDRGLYVHYCPAFGAASAGAAPRSVTRTASGPRAHASHTSWAGWPAKQCLKMDKGPAGESHTLVGLNGVHNWLLGGYGNDTIIGGDDGDVIWGDYHPSGGPPTQTAIIRAGNGRNVIYANDTHNYVWTGTNPRTVVHSHGNFAGVIHCQNPAIVVYLSTVSQRHYKLDGCRHISHYSVGY